MANDKWSGSNPWLGLAPYTEGTPLYGRTKESVQLADIIKDNMASVVFGKSGIGKSSLLSAGISPLLREENYISVRIRLVHNTEVSYVDQIETKVRETVKCIDRFTTEVSNLGLWDFFHRHSFTTKNGIDCIPVIILDQFEEIYTLTDADHKKEIITFFNELSSLLNDVKPDNVIEEERKHSAIQNGSDSATPKRGIIKRSAASALNYTSATTFRFVICLREDKLYLLERNSTNIPSLKANRYNLQALSPESALEVIMCPRPELFSNEEATAIIDKLADMGDEGIRTVDPAILSLFLYKYYEKQGQANYDNIFADYYQEATKGIKGKSIAFLEDHLLTLGGYRNQVPLDDVMSSGVSQSEIDSLLKQIILRIEKRKGIDYIEFSHDRLCAEAKKNRDERTVREQVRKARKRMLLSFLVFAVSAAMLSIVLWLTLKYQASEEGRLSAIEQKELLKEKNDSLALLDALNRHQTDSLLVLNEKNFAQNQLLIDQLTKIEEQQREIEKLSFYTSDSIVINNLEAGKLAERLPYHALVNVVSLTISGDLNGTDIKYLRDGATKMEYLDLSKAKIVNGGTAYYSDFVSKNDDVGEYMFYDLPLTQIILPPTIKRIGKYSFWKCRALTSIIIPNGVTTIGEWAFSDCSALTSVSIPNSVTSIGEWAFDDCSALTSVSIPNSVTSIGARTFSVCSALSSVSIPNSVTSIEFATFAGCSALTSVSIPNSVTSIGRAAFSDCSALTSVSISNGVTTIDDEAFFRCTALTSVTIPNSVTSIGARAFQECSALTSVSIPNSVTSIGRAAFSDCSALTSVTIPNSVTSIGNFAFFECRRLTSVTIPNSITLIGVGVFSGCDDLAHIYSEIKDLERDIFGSNTKMMDSESDPIEKFISPLSRVPSNCTWHVPVGKSKEYQSQPWWVSTWNIVEE